MSEFEKNVIGKFYCYGDQANVGTRWTRWLQSFELFVDSQGILIAEGSDKNKQRRRAQLLHYAGPDVQDIFIHSKILAKLITMPLLLMPLMPTLPRK